MDRLEALQIFIRVAELASFTRAGESLGMPKASVSTAVQQLEAALGARLLHRTTRRVELTSDGRTFYERAKDLVVDFDELASMFQRGAQALSGRLRVDMPSGVARNHVIPRLPEFLAAHPKLEIELSSTDRRVDVVREGFDCVLRVGDPGEGSLVARRLGAFRIVNCASPAYVRRYGEPHSVDDLAQHRLVHYVPLLGGRSPGFEYRDGDRYRSQPMGGVVTVNNSDAYQAACLAGLGIVQVPVVGVQHLLDDERLVEVARELVAEPMPVSLVYANRRNQPKRVQAFMAWVAQT
ncbi:MAG TPA: LysR family transcriptional regulator, partial [Rudaea sp.]|nr:LysR family transcriptional regulator [Rudaea sp.]